MQPAMGVGAGVLTGLAVVGLAFLVVPGDDAARSVGSTRQDGSAQATQAAREFWDLAIDGECREASRLMWWPADRQARREAYAQVCEDSQVPDSVELGDPRAAGSTETPYGATYYLLVPVTLRTEGEAPVRDELRMVEVDDAWYVIR